MHAPLHSYANDLHIGPDGAVYFSDSTVIAPRLNKDGYYDTLEGYMLTQLQVHCCQPHYLESASCKT